MEHKKRLRLWENHRFEPTLAYGGEKIQQRPCYVCELGKQGKGLLRSPQRVREGRVASGGEKRESSHHSVKGELFCRARGERKRALERDLLSAKMCAYKFREKREQRGDFLEHLLLLCGKVGGTFDFEIPPLSLEEGRSHGHIPVSRWLARFRHKTGKEHHFFSLHG